MQRLTRKFALRLGVALQGVEAGVAQATLPRFASSAPGLVIQLPRQIGNPERIFLGRDVKLGPGSVLRAMDAYPGGWLEHPEGEHRSQTFGGEVHIGDRVTATSALQIIAHERVTVEDEVMFAANVFLCDGLHSYERGDLPYKYQGIFRIAPILVGYGSWLGQNVVVMPGVTIGKLAVVGANSVVTRDIPAQTIAAGTPAQPIRRWDASSERWQDARS